MAGRKKSNAYATLASRSDAWSNAWTGLGSRTRDKLMQHQAVRCPPLSDYALEAMFRDDPIAYRIVHELPAQAMGQGFRLTDETGDPDGEESRNMTKLVRPALRKWNVVNRLLEADVWGRTYGGAAIWLGIEGAGFPWEPLDDDKIKKGSLKFLTVLDRRQLHPIDYYMDSLSDNFGQPQTYGINRWTASGAGGGGLRVHETRLLRFRGALTDPFMKIENQGWDLSVLQRVHDTLRTADSNWRSVSHLMTDISQGVMSIENLIEMLAAKENEALATRLEMLDRTRAVNRTILVDAKMEKFERTPTPLGGVPEILVQTWIMTAAAAEMPVTVLFQQAPAGLNASGDNEQRKWYDSITIHQENELANPSERLTRIVAASEGVDLKPGWSVVFPSPWRMTPMEQATFRKTVAETDAIYIDRAVVLPQEVAVARSRGGGREYSADFPPIDLGARKAALAAHNAANPPDDTAEPDDGADKPAPAVQITPSDLAAIVSVNEALQVAGYRPYAGPDGDLTVVEFKAKHAVVLAAATAAEAGKSGPVDPNKVQPAPFGAKPISGKEPPAPPIDPGKEPK